MADRKLPVDCETIESRLFQQSESPDRNPPDEQELFVGNMMPPTVTLIYKTHHESTVPDSLLLTEVSSSPVSTTEPCSRSASQVEGSASDCAAYFVPSGRFLITQHKDLQSSGLLLRTVEWRRDHVVRRDLDQLASLSANAGLSRQDTILDTDTLSAKYESAVQVARGDSRPMTPPPLLTQDNVDTVLENSSGVPLYGK